MTGDGLLSLGECQVTSLAGNIDIENNRVKSFLGEGRCNLTTVSGDQGSEHKPPNLQDVLVARLKAIPDGKISETARRAGMAPEALLRIRRGESTDVKLSTLERIAHGLGESPIVLLGGADRGPAPTAPPQAAAIDPKVVRRVIRKLRGAFDEVEKLALTLPDEDA